MSDAASDTFCIETVHGLKQLVSVETQELPKQDRYPTKPVEKSSEPTANRKPTQSN